MKVIDSFIFYNELDMLNMRLHELNDVVDYFILVEANKTFTNNNKEYFFEKNKEKYDKFLHKIIHIKVDDMPENTGNKDNWDREHYQRNQIKRGLNQLDLNDEDIIILCDVDEIPKVDTIINIKNLKINGIYKLEMDLYYYNFQNKMEDLWPLARVFNYGNIKNTSYIDYLTNIRSLKDFNNNNTIKNGGWHLSYFGDVDFIINKIKQFSHQEFNTEKIINKESLQKLINNNEDLFYRQGIKINKTEHYIQCDEMEQTQLPKYYSMVMFPELNYLTHLGFKYNTDKSWSHLFTEMYFPHFEKIKNKKITILEIGIYLGASLKMLQEYFPNATIHSIDIDKTYLNKNYGKRIKTYNCSQDDLPRFDSIFKDTKFDIILNDGSHQTLHQLISLGHMFKYLNKNGIYVCENLHTSLNRGYCNTNISTLNVLSKYINTKKIISEVISKENTDYLNDNIENLHILHKETNNIKCYKCGKINFDNLKICECKANLGYIENPSITSVIYHK
jgi:beta-1,4-mannosyl-glycoprotein beta-1,4-N-acetylglucosaminyltransferase